MNALQQTGMLIYNIMQHWTYQKTREIKLR